MYSSAPRWQLLWLTRPRSDNVCGGDPKGGADALEGLLVDFADGGMFADLPWAAVEGNHDGESGLNYAQVQAKMLTMHGTINKPNPSYAGAEIYGAS